MLDNNSRTKQISVKEEKERSPEMDLEGLGSYAIQQKGSCTLEATS